MLLLRLQHGYGLNPAEWHWKLNDGNVSLVMEKFVLLLWADQEIKNTPLVSRYSY